MNKKNTKRVAVRFFIFFILGLLLGIVEDLLAIHFATSATITWDVVKIATLVALPFAVLTEIFVDLHLFRSLIKKRLNGK